MVLPDPALGFDVDFDAEGFRRAIKFSMQMGTVNDPDKRPKFVRKVPGRTYWKDGVQLDTAPRTGREGEPLDPDIEVKLVPDVVLDDIDVAVELEDVSTDETGVGNFGNSRAVVTLLDVDYVKIAGCKEMTYNSDLYVYEKEGDVNGLFGVNVHTVIFRSVDES